MTSIGTNAFADTLSMKYISVPEHLTGLSDWGLDPECMVKVHT